MRDSELERLLRAARVANEAPPSAPFGFETRIVARWRAARGESAVDVADLARLLRRTFIAAAVVIAFAGAGAFWQLNKTDDDGEPLTNAYAIADTEIETGLFP